MGWVRDNGEEWSYGHEGYLVAVEKVDGQWREIGLDDQHRGEFGVSHLQVACECGWRSMRFVAPLSTTWAPCSVMTTAAIDDLAYELWADEHRDRVHEGSQHRLLYTWQPPIVSTCQNRWRPALFDCNVGDNFLRGFHTCSKAEDHVGLCECPCGVRSARVVPVRFSDT